VEVGGKAEKSARLKFWDAPRAPPQSVRGGRTKAVGVCQVNGGRQQLRTAPIPDALIVRHGISPKAGVLGGQQRLPESSRSHSVAKPNPP
jgi:hypothetical protein